LASQLTMATPATPRPVDALIRALRQALICYMVERGNLDAYPGMEAKAAEAQAIGDLLAQAERALAKMTGG
jgi:hypothetical protein